MNLDQAQEIVQLLVSGFPKTKPLSNEHRMIYARMLQPYRIERARPAVEHLLRTTKTLPAISDLVRAIEGGVRADAAPAGQSPDEALAQRIFREIGMDQLLAMTTQQVVNAYRVEMQKLYPNVWTTGCSNGHNSGVLLFLRSLIDHERQKRMADNLDSIPT